MGHKCRYWKCQVHVRLAGDIRDALHARHIGNLNFLVVHLSNHHFLHPAEYSTNRLDRQTHIVPDVDAGHGQAKMGGAQSASRIAAGDTQQQGRNTFIGRILS
jgi:hypothetical protein